jgi:hypothetical protein
MHTTQQALSINTEVCDPVGKFAFPHQIRWEEPTFDNQPHCLDCWLRNRARFVPPLTVGSGYV